MLFLVFRWMLPGSTLIVWQTRVVAVVEATVSVSAPVWRHTLNAAATRVFLSTGELRLCAVSHNIGSEKPTL